MVAPWSDLPSLYLFFVQGRDCAGGRGGGSHWIGIVSLSRRGVWDFSGSSKCHFSMKISHAWSFHWEFDGGSHESMKGTLRGHQTAFVSDLMLVIWVSGNSRGVGCEDKTSWTLKDVSLFPVSNDLGSKSVTEYKTWIGLCLGFENAHCLGGFSELLALVLKQRPLEYIMAEIRIFCISVMAYLGCILTKWLWITSDNHIISDSLFRSHALSCVLLLCKSGETIICANHRLPRNQDFRLNLKQQIILAVQTGRGGVRELTVHLWTKRVVYLVYALCT